MLRVCLFVLLLLSCLVASTTHAQSEDVIETREVVVSSTRLPDAPVDARTLPAKVTVITAEDIRKSGAKTVQEAMQWANNIVMYDLVGNGFQQTIDLRGFNSQPVPSTSVFVDGQRINEPDFNTINFDLIPFDTIERIEIIPGPATIYGKNAMGGVVNIITKRGGDKRQVTSEALFGSWGRQRYTINASGPIGKFDYYVNLGKEKEDGYRDDSRRQHLTCLWESRLSSDRGDRYHTFLYLCDGQTFSGRRTAAECGGSKSESEFYAGRFCRQ